DYEEVEDEQGVHRDQGLPVIRPTQRSRRPAVDAAAQPADAVRRPADDFTGRPAVRPAERSRRPADDSIGRPAVRSWQPADDFDGRPTVQTADRSQRPADDPAVQLADTARRPADVPVGKPAVELQDQCTVGGENYSPTVHHKQSSGSRNYHRRRSMSMDEAKKTMNGNRMRPIDSSIVVPRFDGTGDLELFLKRFLSVARFYSWTEEETLFRLEHSIVDNAQYVLLDMPSARTVDQFTEILRSRFGVAASTEQYRAELGRLRRGTMTLQELHLEVRRLVNKAFPGQWSMSTEVYARDAFLNALDDS
ncbi:MAG TPA: hypothetical protein VLS45_05815, partial [Methylomicrobium sp.]|nr:hypothetical protein [Methylomicrobium sp.]